MKQVAIIGAGIAGLSAARALCAAGDNRVTLFEKSAGLGGRVATRRLNGCIVDHGAQVIKPQGNTLLKVMRDELPTDDLIEVTAPVRLYQNDGTILPADPRYAAAQYTYRQGINTLAKLLFAALPQEQVTLHREVRIERIEENTEGFTFHDEAGNRYGEFDAVIATPPAPQTVELLRSGVWRDPETMRQRAERLASIAYHPCLTVLLGYSAPVPEPPAYALLAEDRTRPLLWLAFEQTKSPERAPDGGAVLIAQLGSEFSATHYSAEDTAILAETLSELRQIFGADYAVPAWSQVKRWRYSQPKTHGDFAEINPEGTRFIICGDALRPENGRVHQAFESGIEGAKLVTAK